MRAAVLEAARSALRVEELELESPRAGEVLVRIAASGVCHSDLHQADGDWGETGPMVLGHEGAGIVEAVGEGVTTPRAGELVALNWYYPCLSCEACQRGRQWMCSGSGALDNRMPDGTNRLRRADGTEVAAYLALGTFAERTVVPAQAAVPVPDEVPPEVAALIGCSVTTGVMAALRTAGIRPGSSVAVIGLGGVGLSVVMGAALAGAATIVAVDLVPAKLDRARDVGATHTVVASDPEATHEAIREATAGGPEFAFEAVGLASTIELAVSVLPMGGTAVLVGLTRYGERPSFDAFDLVDGSRRIVGANYGWSIPAVDFPRLAGLYLTGRLPVDRLIDERIGLDGVNAAFDAMRRGEGVRRVIVF